ncbi:helix-turn-helix transcriptional regulator [Paenibacillus cymbidii]|uniref:helix-turn-helix transcriptional regulator n=1 Tax=Paenibacillus cymbidii TaxID=1639034 RepID=UPI001F45F53D|nr:AraC family transcriptional regulator [Paenibacillus cymbidii]
MNLQPHTPNDLMLLSPQEAALRADGFFHPPYITLAHLFNAPQGWHLGMRKFRQYQLQYVLNGAAYYTIEGTEYLTRKGDLILHSPNELHDVVMLPDMPYVCVSIVFHFGASAFPLQEWLAGANYMGNYEGEPTESMLTEVAAEFHQPGPLHRFRCQQLLMAILYEVLRRHSKLYSPDNGEESQASRMRANIVLVKNYIRDHYAETITFKELERVSGWSKNHITSRFKAAYGVTPMQYQIRVRMDRAKELAIQSSMSVTEIALAVGYSDVHTFGKTFKKKTGLSLSEYCASLVV